MNNFGKRLLSSICQKRKFHTTQVRLIDPKTVEEVRIPVPWGHIAGKWWGRKTNSPILAIHGYIDNANSFDRLMPLLNIPGVLCIDLPGHGHSSHIPPGFITQYFEYIIHLRYLLKKALKWEKVSFIGHSYGSSLCFAYTGIFPDDVDYMVNIDCSRLFSSSLIERTVSDTRECVELALDSEKEIAQKSFTWEQSLKHTYNARNKGMLPLALDACEIIARRGTKQLDNDKFIFHSDRRLRNFGFTFPATTTSAIAKRVSCNVLNLLPINGFSSIKILDEFNKELLRQVEVMKLAKRRVISVNVNGAHHVHLESPENVSPYINDFLKDIYA